MAERGKYRAFDGSLDTVLNSVGRKFILREEQRLALESFVANKRDALALPPTGFGKSLIYQLAPLVAKEMGFSQTPVVAVVSPLTALMEDQVKEAVNLGISATQLCPEQEHAIKSCQATVFYSAVPMHGLAFSGRACYLPPVTGQTW